MKNRISCIHRPLVFYSILIRALPVPSSYLVNKPHFCSLGLFPILLFTLHQLASSFGWLQIHFPHKTLTIQNMHIILCHGTDYCLPLPPHVSKILSNVSQEENSRTQMAHKMAHINCFPVYSTLFIVTFNEGENSPFSFPGRGL